MSEEDVIRREQTELYVGAFIAVGLAIMGLLVWQFGRISDRLAERYQINLLMKDATGIVLGGQVRFGGEPIGFVSHRELMEDFTGVTLTLDIKEQFNIPKGSDFMIATSGLMGDKYINIIPPKERTKEYIQPGADVRGSGSDLMGELTASLSRITEKLEIVLDDLSVTMDNMSNVTTKLDDRVMSQQNLTNYTDTITQLQETTQNLALASQKLEPLVEQTHLTVATAAKPFDRATVAIEKLEPAIVDLQKTIRGIDSAIDQIVTGDGVTAALISDESLRADLESFVANLERYGILGYKGGKKKADASDEDDNQSSTPANTSRPDPVRRPGSPRRP